MEFIYNLETLLQLSPAFQMFAVMIIFCLFAIFDRFIITGYALSKGREPNVLVRCGAILLLAKLAMWITSTG